MICFTARIRTTARYAVCAGLDQVIDYIKSLHFDYDDIDYLTGTWLFFDEDFLNYLASFHFTGDIYAIPEGSVVFPMRTTGESGSSDYGGAAG